MAKKRSMAYMEKAKLIDATKVYSIPEALTLLKKISYTKFAGSVELNVNLNIDPLKSDQRITFTITLPFSTGKSKKVVVLCDGKDTEIAKTAGADDVFGEELIAKIEKGYLDFDYLVTTPEMMPKIAKIAKILGPKGLMPNPKNQTVTTNIKSTVDNLKQGQITIKSGEQTTLKTVVGKIDQDPLELEENIKLVVKSILENKPAKIKGDLIKSVYLSTTMSPSVRVQFN